MIKSMTGFAALTREDGVAAINVTLRAVNHRFLDVQLRMPSSLADQEARVRAVLQRGIARGRIELAVGVQSARPMTTRVELNDAFVTELEGALERARQRGLVAGQLTPGDLLRLPQALVIKEMATAEPDDQEALGAAVVAAVEAAVTELDGMRVHEGRHLRDDLDARGRMLGELIARIADAAVDGQAGLQTRLAARVTELTDDLPVDRVAIAQEIVRMVGRSDISEEITRFRAHLEHWAALTDSAEPCGRKLEFLLQEMNREINTIGSKGDGQQVSELIVTAKAELEKMREQVQNVE